jgi:hypothetical protein
MDIETTAKAMQYILAPVVMISASAILLNGLQTRYTTLNSRLREMAHERLQLVLENREPVEYQKERLTEIDSQLPRLLRHYARVHMALMIMYLAILLFIMNMFLIAIAYQSRSPMAANAALTFFLVAAATLLLAILVNMRDFRDSHRLTEFEVNRVLLR